MDQGFILYFSSKFLQKTTRYYKGIFHAVSTICRDEGVKGLYKGLGATLLVGHGPSTYIWFFNVGLLLTFRNYRELDLV